MPAFKDHPNSNRIKLLLLGDSKSGKTGGLTTLANVGYNVNILDLDNNLKIMDAYFKGDARDRVKYASIPARDPGTWDKAKTLLRKWDDGSKPEDWDENTVLVIDSATFWAESALSKARAELQIPEGQKTDWDGYAKAADYVENEVARITSAKFKCHVIFIAHWRTLQDKTDKVFKVVPSFIGQNLPRAVPRYCNNVWGVLVGKDGERTLLTSPKKEYSFVGNSAPTLLKAEEPYDLGAAFKKLT